ncbi:S-layer homology domain-containing protein [Heyndrickxia oleronia]|uniref:S-layer homology domain-containing protein n=1 Tax=Heyndrickxia oleronia TaxID=38875 RepID=UPI001C0EC1AC|nr:S-layer homology domain-containing protein [Heyndrickxia oleronia]MBU5211840.1 FIVAR domain-containing protein [Heyndrickxia oleronia]
MQKKQKKWWQRSCAAVLSVSLVASSLSLSLAPKTAEAATTGTPGGVSENLLSWVDIGKSRQYDANNNVISLEDLADVTRKWVPARGTFTKADSESVINFNPGMTSSSSNLVWYSTDQFNMDDTEREIFSVQKNDSVTSSGFPFEFGGGSKDESPKYQNTNLKAYFGSDIGENIPNELSLTQPRILNSWGAVNDWALSLDGKLLQQKNKNTPIYSSNNDRTPKYYIGAGHSSVLNGNLSEVIVFNRKLNDVERQKVNSYLALKYGITLNDNYIASEGSPMWTATKNEDYGYRITGIGRDDAGALYQKQSKSVDTGALVTLAVGKTIEPSNSANNGEIPDLSFLTFSDNNNALGYNINIDEANLPSTLAPVNDTTKIAAKRMERVFKVEKNGTWQPDQDLTLQIDGADKDLHRFALYISDVEGFNSASTVAVPMDKDTGKVTIKNSQLPDAYYFTFIQYADKKELETLANDLETLKQADYTPATWTVFDNALTAAKGVLADPDATQKQVDEALTALNTARENLKKSTTGGPAITTSPGDTVAVIVNNKIENGPVVVDAGVTLDSSVLNGYEDNLNGASVAIENFKKEDKLEFTSVNGITGNFNPATGILTLSGKASIEDYQAVLRSVTFTTTSTDRTDRNITFTLGSALAYSENGHFYEYINKNATITWFNAKKEAEEKNYFGRKGYLVTITSENENNFVKDKTLGLGWIGAKDIERNPENNPDPSATYPKNTGDWRWVTGPEGLEEGGGLQFYTGYAQSGSKVKYANWAAGEPNDYNGSGEYVAHIFGPGTDSGRWNDYSPNNAGVKGYVIEYGDMPGDQTFALSASKKIVFVDKTNLKQKIDEETTLTETDYTTDSWSNYQTQLTAAQKVLENPNATQEEVNQVLADLTAAYDALQEVPGVNKEPLQAKVDEAKDLDASDYTAETWAAYQEQIKAAQAVLDDEDATQEEVDQALEDLTAAYDALQEVPGVNKEPLQAKVDEAKDLDASDYTAETWAAYQEQVKAAQAVLVDEDATQEEVDQALEDLTAAQEALKEVTGVNKEKLQSKVEEAAGLTETDYTSDTWTNYQTQLTAAQKVLDDPNATQEEVDQALADLNAAQNALKPVLTTPGLSSLIPSEGTLSPIFSSEVSNYTMNVDYATSQLSFWATASNPGATVTMTVNGQIVSNSLVPLQVGANTVVITVQDGTEFKQYTITIYRAADSSSGGGGGTWTPDPSPTPTPSKTTTKIQVELEIDGKNPLEKTTVEIERTKHANGEIYDFVALTEANAKEAVEKAKQIGNNIARIVIPDVNDEVDQVTVEVPKQSLQILRENGLTLEISTENGHIAIPHSSMEGVDNNFYFRLVPVKKESERKAIEERAKVEKVVRETLQSDDVHVIARPMTIETNMPSRPVQVTLPLKGVNVPSAAAERQAFLDQLAVFIEHSDGEKKVVRPEIVTMNDGKQGLRFTVDKFSTFTIIQFEKPEVSEHKAYIKGFPNGTFGPDKNVTRAQVAIMIARLLGYTEDQTVNQAPFKDVAKDHSAAGEIAFVKQQGIMNGDNKGLFHANANITRAEMAAVVANFKQLSVDQGVTITFNDTKGHWAQWIIEANRTAGIINGFEDGSFAPNAPLTRAQAVVMMNRMFERGPLNGVTAPSFPDVKATHWAFKDIEEAANSHSYLVDKEGNEQFTK